MSTSQRVSDLLDSINKIDRRILAGYVLGGLVFTVCVIAAAIVPPSTGLQIVLCFFDIGLSLALTHEMETYHE